MATVLLNKTHHKHALPAFNDIRKRWPTIEALSKGEIIPFSARPMIDIGILLVSPDELEKLIHHLGLSRDRSRRIIEMAQMWIKDPPTPDKLYRSRVKEPGLSSDTPACLIAYTRCRRTQIPTHPDFPFSRNGAICARLLAPLL